MLQQQHAVSIVAQHEKRSKEEQGYLASVKVDDLVRPRDPRKVVQEKCDKQKGFLNDQVQQKREAEKAGDGMFFGMTDEEILMNREHFKQMGLLS